MSDPVRSRGASHNPKNRFERIECVPEPGSEEGSPLTEFFRDRSQSIISRNDSPDIGMEASVNPYRGCEHGCIYCYARPTHEYFGLSAGLDFETKILVKEDAPALLRRELSSDRWTPAVVTMSGVTDPYQPIERRLKITRRCLEVLGEFLNPVAIITKSDLVIRDVDVLAELARHQCAAVFLSVTTLDHTLSRTMEPRTTPPTRRLRAIEALAKAGVPVGTMIGPVIPGLTDHEIPSILQAAVEAGARFAGHTLVRLPYAVAPLFEKWLAQHFPDRQKKVLDRIRETRGGKLNDPRFHSRMSGEGPLAELIHALFAGAARKLGILGRRPPLSTAKFRRASEGAQLKLFG